MVRVGGRVVGAVVGLLGGVVKVGELRREVPLQNLRPPAQDDEEGGVGLRLDQLGQSVEDGSAACSKRLARASAVPSRAATSRYDQPRRW
jgi:hypothetical protein